MDRAIGAMRLASADLTALGFVNVVSRPPWISPDGSIALFGAVTENGVGALLPIA